MCSKSYFMAFLRLAKIQINTWGHSDSSGIDTIDYFISSKLYEYDEAKINYSEQLILLDSICTSYYNPSEKYNINTFKNRYNYGITDEVIVFFCAQSLFKFNPVFDDYILNILNSVENSILIILNNEAIIDIVKRFDNKNISHKIKIFPMMNHYDYMNLINISDIVLDSYPFGGCNSSFEAFSLNKVIVTQPSNMINGRFTSGFYKKMNLDEFICNSKNEYIDFSIKLALNKKYREECSNKIKNNKLCLFNDNQSIIEWNEILLDLFNRHII